MEIGSFKALSAKKAAIFTVTAIIMVSILMFAAVSYDDHRYRQRAFTEETKIKAIDYFIEDLERDIRRGMYIATYRSLVGIQQYITNEGTYIDDYDKVFKEIIINGSIDGEYISVMNSTELSVWFDKINYEASKISIGIDYEIEGLDVRHIDPWTLVVVLDVVLNITDNSKTAYWIRDYPINTTISIEHFEDPLYSVSTFGRVINTITRNNVSVFVDGENTSGLIEFIDNSYYLANNASPSYLMRLVGDFNASEFGIESIVDLREVEAVGLSVLEKSCVDFIYFSVDQDPREWQINNTYNWLRLDNESGRLEIYDAGDLIIP